MKVTVVNTLAPYHAQTISNAHSITHLEETQTMRVSEIVTENDEQTNVDHDFPDKYLFMIET